MMARTCAACSAGVGLETAGGGAGWYCGIG